MPFSVKAILELRFLREDYRLYVLSLLDDVPEEVYEGMLSLLCVGLVTLLVVKGKKAWKGIAILLLAEYIFFIFCFTFLFRDINPESGHCFIPFWSYSRQELVVENVMNTVVFLPVGILLFLTRKKSQRFNFVMAILIGLIITLVVEILQLLFKKGFCEVDDLIHNTIGCIIGYTFCLIIARTWNYTMNWCSSHWGQRVKQSRLSTNLP